jgi:hypothetical protein
VQPDDDLARPAPAAVDAQDEDPSPLAGPGFETRAPGARAWLLSQHGRGQVGGRRRVGIVTEVAPGGAASGREMTSW